MGIWTKVFCTFGPYFVIKAWTGDKLSNRKAQNGVKVDVQVQFNLEPTPKTIGILTKVLHFWSKFSDSRLNMWQVIARTSSKSMLMDTWTYRQMQAMTTPKGQNWKRIKLDLFLKKCRGTLSPHYYMLRLLSTSLWAPGLSKGKVLFINDCKKKSTFIHGKL